MSIGLRLSLPGMLCFYADISAFLASATNELQVHILTTELTDPLDNLFIE